MYIKSEKLRDSNYTCIDTHTHTCTHIQTLNKDINILLNTTGPITCPECSVDTTLFTASVYHKEVGGNTCTQECTSNSDSGLTVEHPGATT